MSLILGTLFVFACVLGLYSIHGNVLVLWQPIEFGIIFGGAFGAFVIGYPKRIVIGAFKSVGTMLKGPHYKSDNYNELLCVLYLVFKLAKTKGDLALETHIDSPEESSLFAGFPLFQADQRERNNCRSRVPAGRPPYVDGK